MDFAKADYIGLFRGPAEERLQFVVEMMQEMSRQTDPQKMVSAYSMRMREMLHVDGFISLSRRDLSPPKARITRSHLWGTNVNPWKATQQHFVGSGLISELIWNGDARIIDDLAVASDDPAAEHFAGMQSLLAMPLYDRGESLNMIILLRKTASGFDPEILPEHLWLSNLFGRATHNLVLSEELKRAYESVDREMKVVADIQRSLLPSVMPPIPGLELAAHYLTSKRAGGDYYDFFELADGRWGILVADVSGHGTPAAVIMAITHSIAHNAHSPTDPPSKQLKFINQHLAARYTNGNGTFVTAFYGIYNPATRELTYCSAGHCPPRVRACGSEGVRVLDGAPGLPLGIDADEIYTDATATLSIGDILVLYTDGITEARPAGSSELFGTDRLDKVLGECVPNAQTLLDATLAAVTKFTGNAPLTDDQTLLVGKVVP